jgi:hypothetical protein
VPLDPSPCLEFYCFDGAAFDGNTLVAIGSMTYPAAYVSARNVAGQWGLQQVLEPGSPPVPFIGPLYEKPVAVSANEIFLRRFAEGGSGATCVTDVYRRTGTRWDLLQTIAMCGVEVVADHGRLLFNSAGVVRLYTRQRGGEYVLTGTLSPGDGSTFGPGATVSMQGWTIAVGSPSANADTGAVYVFQRWGRRWVLKRKIMPGPDVVPGARFGAAVSVSGSNIAIAAPGLLVLDTNSRGVAYVYTGIGSFWYPRQQIADPVADDSGLRTFATEIELHGRRLIISSYNPYPGAEGPFTFYYERPLWEVEWQPTAVLRAGRALTIAISGGTAMVDTEGLRGGSYPAIYNLPPLSMTPPPWLPSHMSVDDGMDGEVSSP